MSPGAAFGRFAGDTVAPQAQALRDALVPGQQHVLVLDVQDVPEALVDERAHDLGPVQRALAQGAEADGRAWPVPAPAAPGRGAGGGPDLQILRVRPDQALLPAADRLDRVVTHRGQV